MADALELSNEVTAARILEKVCTDGIRADDQPSYRRGHEREQKLKFAIFISEKGDPEAALVMLEDMLHSDDDDPEFRFKVQLAIVETRLKCDDYDAAFAVATECFFYPCPTKLWHRGHLDPLGDDGLCPSGCDDGTRR